jgi:hypothetical protein
MSDIRNWLKNKINFVKEAFLRCIARWLTIVRAELDFIFDYELFSPCVFTFILIDPHVATNVELFFDVCKTLIKVYA